jgi:hypothetical protein
MSLLSLWDAGALVHFKQQVGSKSRCNQDIQRQIKHWHAHLPLGCGSGTAARTSLQGGSSNAQACYPENAKVPLGTPGSRIPTLGESAALEKLWLREWGSAALPAAPPSTMPARFTPDAESAPDRMELGPEPAHNVRLSVRLHYRPWEALESSRIQPHSADMQRAVHGSSRLASWHSLAREESSACTSKLMRPDQDALAVRAEATIAMVAAQHPPVSPVALPPPMSAVMPRSSHLPMLDTSVPALKLRPRLILLACMCMRMLRVGQRCCPAQTVPSQGCTPGLPTHTAAFKAFTHQMVPSG